MKLEDSTGVDPDASRHYSFQDYPVSRHSLLSTKS